MQKSGFFSKQQIVFFLIVIGIATAVYFGRGLFVTGPSAPQGGFGIPVETAEVSSRALDITIDSVGTLVANESVILRPETTGRITEIKFVEGQPVKKGDLLFQIDDRMARAELKQAEANHQLAQLNNERFSKLSKTGAATKRAFDEARANLGVAQANRDLAKTRVDYSRITAPFDGVVGLRNVSPGDYVNLGQELANFVSYDPMKVNFNIPEKQAAQLAVNQLLDITVEALPGETFHGVLYALDPQIDVNGRSVSLRATIPNPDMKLKPGYFARVVLTVSRKEGALLVPESAIVPQGDAKMVFKVGADDTVSIVPVTLGERLQGEVEILSGVSAGDVVVTSGQIKLQPGAKVTDLRKMNAAKEAAAPAAATPAAKEESTAPAEPVAPSEEESAPVGEDGALTVPLTGDEGAHEEAPAAATEEGAAQ